MGTAFARPLLLPCRPGVERLRFSRQVRCALHLPRAQSGARTAPAPTRAGAGARAGYARIRVPPSGEAGGGANDAIRNVRRVQRGGGADGTEWNETGWRNDMQDADGYGFEEAGRTLELFSPACRKGRKRASGRATGQGRARLIDGLPPGPPLAERRREKEERTPCPKRPQDMRHAHAEHDIP